jgi:hypothetical protein
MRIFGARWEEVAEGWRRLHKDKIHTFYDPPNIISVIK